PQAVIGFAPVCLGRRRRRRCFPSLGRVGPSAESHFVQEQNENPIRVLGCLPEASFQAGNLRLVSRVRAVLLDSCRTQFHAHAPPEPTPHAAEAVVGNLWERGSDASQRPTAGRWPLGGGCHFLTCRLPWALAKSFQNFISPLERDDGGSPH